MTNPNDFDDRETRERLYNAQRRYHRVVVWLFIISVTFNFVLGSSIAVFELQAAHGRDVIADCIRPGGKCAKNAIDASHARGAAIVYCQKILPADTTRDAVLRCIIRNSSGR
jgi:hypothetical protein